MSAQLADALSPPFGQRNRESLDQSFVIQIAPNPDQPIVRAIISMGRSLQLRIIAEGVETPQELALRREQQCDDAQGYHFSRPVVAEDFAPLLRSGVPL